MNETALEADAQAMCDRVNGQGDYAENIGQRRTGWLAQARSGVAAYLAALATPKPPVDEMPLLDKIEAEARRYAGMYADASDGRNTFVLFADYVANIRDRASA